ncbi:hypothetical protein TNCV_597891 [Trichonephila clavipes]|nr:hypothetical protein TNCV_597891 [Trichonephila clavipes]
MESKGHISLEAGRKGQSLKTAVDSLPGNSSSSHSRSGGARHLRSLLKGVETDQTNEETDEKIRIIHD